MDPATISLIISGVAQVPRMVNVATTLVQMAHDTGMSDEEVREYWRSAVSRYKQSSAKWKQLREDMAGDHS